MNMDDLGDNPYIVTIVTKLQPGRAQPTATSTDFTDRQEVGDEYLIPREIRQNFTSWPEQLRFLPEGTIIEVSRVWVRWLHGVRNAIYTELCWEQRGEVHKLNILWTTFHCPQVNYRYHSIKPYLLKHDIPPLIPEHYE